MYIRLSTFYFCLMLINEVEFIVNYSFLKNNGCCFQSVDQTFGLVILRTDTLDYYTV